MRGRAGFPFRFCVSQDSARRLSAEQTAEAVNLFAQRLSLREIAQHQGVCELDVFMALWRDSQMNKTPSKLRILELAKDGKGYKQIASEVGLSTTTIARTLRRNRAHCIRPKKVTTEVEAQIVRMAGQGNSLESISAALSIDASVISRCARRNGIRRQEENTKLTAEVKARVLDMIARGEKYQTIAEAIGATKAMVSRFACQNGIRRQEAGRKLTPEVKKRILELAAKGECSSRQIAVAVGVSRSLVSMFLCRWRKRKQA